MAVSAWRVAGLRSPLVALGLMAARGMRIFVPVLVVVVFLPYLATEIGALSEFETASTPQQQGIAPVGGDSTLSPQATVLNSHLLVGTTRPVEGWPATTASQEQLRERNFTCDQPIACMEWGAICFLDCQTALLSCTEENYPVMYFRLSGPSVIECQLVKVGRGENCDVHYHIAFPAGATGDYELQGIVMYESPHVSLQAPPICAEPCIGTRFSVGPVRIFPTISTFQALAPCHPTQISTDGGFGRWVVGEGKEMHWQPWTCTLKYPNYASGALSKEGLVLIGDSQDELFAKYLGHHTTLNVLYMPARGLVDHYIPADLMESGYKTCKTRPILFEGRSGGAIEIFQHVCSQLSADYMQNGYIPWVLIQGGHWDLRDSSLEEYRRNFAVLLQHMLECSLLKGRLIVRTAPSYSYRRSQATAGREYRTNTKFQLAAEFIREQVEIFEPDIHLLDSFSFTSPRFEESCDTHHYFCKPESDGNGYSIEAVVTVPSLLRIMGFE